MQQDTAHQKQLEFDTGPADTHDQEKLETQMGFSYR